MIVGEIEGDRARLARATRSDEGPIELSHETRFERGDLHAFEERFEAFMRECCPNACAAALAVGGPVEEGAARLTKESFIVSERRLTRRFNLDRVTLMNDFVALARGVVEVPPDSFMQIIAGDGEEAAGLVVVGPGVGLGMAAIRKRNNSWRVQESEGGHQAYAPGDLDEMAIWRALLPNRHYVTFEDIICEAGVLECYRQLCRSTSVAPALASFEEVAAAGRAGEVSAAVRACEIAARSLATFAGNGCLAFGARGGVVIAGSVARALQSFLVDPSFAVRFQRRGPMTLYLADVPVRLLRDESAGLRGLAAHCFAEPA